MPLLKIQVSEEVSSEKVEVLLERGTDLVVDLMGKPRGVVQVVVEPGMAMAFGGEAGNSALVELRSLGLPEDMARELSAGICGMLEGELGVPAERVFITFFDFPRPMWGWDGKTFG
ncbi:MAG: hypothetical protein CMO66_01075 [Verrucomicrobiales bacterium]|nr:hypothetical protein [Verrucomicrobiales bacterium]